MTALYLCAWWADLVKKPVGPTAWSIYPESHFSQWGNVIDLHVKGVLLTSLKPFVHHHIKAQSLESWVWIGPLFILQLDTWMKIEIIDATCPHSSAAASPLYCRWPQKQSWRSGCLFPHSAHLRLPLSPHRLSNMERLSDIKQYYPPTSTSTASLDEHIRINSVILRL